MEGRQMGSHRGEDTERKTKCEEDTGRGRHREERNWDRGDIETRGE
jgi:hypothetical protein